MDANSRPLHAEQQALLAAFAEILAPLAALCIARGVTIQPMEELLRQAFVSAARRACNDAGAQGERVTSRISTMTGLTRREVTRLALAAQQAAQANPTPARSLASEMLTRWVSQRPYLDRKGRPRPLPRLGKEPSFESLAASITRDVHPRSMLAEMQRLGLVTHEAASDRVSLVAESFVPRTDWPRMVGFLGANVGAHLHAAVGNVIGTGSEHFEQALMADELSAESLERARALIAGQWRHLMTTLGPQLQALMDADQAAGRPQDQALRVGLYSWMHPMAAPAAPASASTAAPPAAPRRTKRKPTP
jgi:Family of unknown function (DUF6502)